MHVSSPLDLLVVLVVLVLINETWINSIRDKMEPILKHNPYRFVLFPIEYPEIYDMYKKQVGSFWTASEIDLADDVNDWNSLNENERTFLKKILAFFASSDGIVMENINTMFGTEVQVSEIRLFYAAQSFIESIHSEMYSLMLSVYVTNKEEQEQLFHAIETIQPIKEKASWALRYFDPSLPFAERLVAFACVECIQFSGSFAAIFWIRKRGLLKGLTTANQFIARDEGLHVQFACHVYKHLIENKLPATKVHEIVESAVQLELMFFKDALDCRLIGMNNELMNQYIFYVADYLLSMLGVEKLYNVQNPFEFMSLISVESKSNFFEVRPSEYTRAGVVSGDSNFVLNNDDDDF